MTLKEQYTAVSDHRYVEVLKTMKKMAVDHVSENPGHQVWTHFRNPMDFHVECFTCRGKSNEGSK